MSIATTGDRRRPPPGRSFRSPQCGSSTPISPPLSRQGRRRLARSHGLTTPCRSAITPIHARSGPRPITTSLAETAGVTLIYDNGPWKACSCTAGSRPSPAITSVSRMTWPATSIKPMRCIAASAPALTTGSNRKKSMLRSNRHIPPVGNLLRSARMPVISPT